MRRLIALALCLAATTVLAQQAGPFPLLAVPAAAAQAAGVAIQSPPVTATPATQPNSEEFAKAVYFGRKFFDMKDYASAYEQFARADALQPDNPGVLYDMAVLLAKAGRYSEAQTKVDRYLHLFPSGTEGSLVSKLQLELGFQRELQKKRQADENYLELFNRGKFLYGKGELDGALKQFQQAEQQRPNDDPAAIYNQAVVLEAMGDLQKAAGRLHRFAELESDSEAKAGLDQHLLTLESQIEDTKTKILCPFCGLRLPIGATWCPRCWHGAYLTASPVWNSRPCVEGASATRATHYADGRFAKNDSLPCLFSGTMLDALRFSPKRQRNIQEARKAEGWTYTGDIIQGWSDKQGNQIKYVQGTGYLEKVVSPAGGDILTYAAHATPDGIWLLDREDFIVEGQRYLSRYTFDATNHIAQQQVEYQNAAACNHLIAMTADYTYANDVVSLVKIHGGYDGYVPEGSPHVDWDATVAYTYDASGRVAKEDLTLYSLNKIYTQKPIGAYREEISKVHVGMRARRPIENALRTGDLCGTSGTLLLGNMIDLRPFYAMSPNLAMQLPYGVTKAAVSFTYPESYKVR
jgi:tetratricopeptide (TPR) repeat protein